MKLPFTKEQFEKMPIKNLTIDECMKIITRLYPTKTVLNKTRKSLERMEDRDFVLVHQHKDGELVRIYVKKIFVKRFTLPYSAKKGGGYIGKEVMYSSLPFPKGNPLKIK